MRRTRVRVRSTAQLSFPAAFGFQRARCVAPQHLGGVGSLGNEEDGRPLKGWLGLLRLIALGSDLTLKGALAVLHEIERLPLLALRSGDQRRVRIT